MMEEPWPCFCLTEYCRCCLLSHRWLSATAADSWRWRATAAVGPPQDLLRVREAMAGSGGSVDASVTTVLRDMVATLSIGGGGEQRDRSATAAPSADRISGVSVA